MTREAIDAVWEHELPNQAASVFRAAQAEALQAGLSVLEVVDGTLFRRYPDGHREYVKNVSPPIRYRVGQKFRLRKP